MAKAAATLIASALCVLALAGFARSHEAHFTVMGNVYCDTCQILFETVLSKPVNNAEVELRCRHVENGTLTYTMSTTTDQSGIYSLNVLGDHEDEICDVVVVSNPDPTCSTIVPEIDSSRVCLTKNLGIKGSIRFANPIGFVKDVPHPDCKRVINALAFDPNSE